MSARVACVACVAPGGTRWHRSPSGVVEVRAGTRRAVILILEDKPDRVRSFCDVLARMNPALRVAQRAPQ